MRIFITVFILSIQCLLYSKEDSTYIDTIWTNDELKLANTARFSFYLSRKGKEVIQLMNLARMYCASSTKSSL
jgi:hypothetical protein